MSKIVTSSKRGRRGAKRLDIAEVKKALRDRRLWSGLGVVRRFPGETAHYEIEVDDQPDVLVDVELVPNGERVFCRLGIAVGAVWKIPPVDTEVAVLIPEGDFDADPIIVAVLEAPPDLLSETTVVIVAPSGGEVLIYDGSGSPEPVVKKSEFDGHTHPATGLTCTGGTVAGNTSGAAAVTGTEVLKAK